MKKDRNMSAQVVLIAASGKRFDAHTQITSQNVHEYEPSGQAVTETSRVLQDKGFKTGPCIGNSFSIEGPVSLFESVFKCQIEEKDGGPKFCGSGLELPKDKIPATIRSQVLSITFSRPPDFGPTKTTSFG